MFITAVCLAMMAPAVFALDFTSSSSTVLGSVVFTPSTNVTVNAVATDGSDATNPNQYCVTSFHGSSVNQTSGKQYAALSGGGTGNVNTAIVWATLAGVSTPPRCTVVNAWPTGTWQ
jgi:hypothetical protein